MYPKIAVIIPAWNEEKTIAEVIKTVFNQDCPLEKVIVVADNCSDDTVGVVTNLYSQYDQLECIETIENKARKAGALNQAIRHLPEDIEYVLVLDADTRAAPDVVSQAALFLREDPRLGGICARTHLTPLPRNASLIEKVLWRLQRLEYATADSRRVERLGNIKILAGSCVMYHMGALRQVAEYRGNGQFYDESSLIEDYELTLTLKSLGWRTTLGITMHSWTDVPLSPKIHWQQRIRWARSHVDTLRQKGWNKTTRHDIISHVIFCLILPQQIFFLGILAYLLLSQTSFTWNPLLWVMIPLLWADRLYRIRYVPNVTLTDVLIRMAFIPEELYGLWHSVQRVWSYWLAFTGGPERWLET